MLECCHDSVHTMKADLCQVPANLRPSQLT